MIPADELGILMSLRERFGHIVESFSHRKELDLLHFKTVLWETYEPHLISFLQDPEAFGVKPVHMRDLNSPSLSFMRSLLLRRLEDKNENFIALQFDKNYLNNENIVGYGVLFTQQDVKDIVEHDEELKRLRIAHTLTKNFVQYRIISHISRIFNCLHNVNNNGYHENPTLTWLNTAGYGFVFVDEDKPMNGKSKKRISFTPREESMTDGYVRLLFYKPKVYTVNK